MAKKQVIAYFMHEHERDEAVSKMPQAQQTESYVMGEVEESDIPQLKQKGLFIQQMAEHRTTSDLMDEIEAVHGTPRRTAEALRTAGAVPGMTRAAPEPRPIAGGVNFYLVRLRGPLLEEWRNEIQTAGIKFSECFPTRVYKARLTPAQVQRLSQLKFVESVRLYSPEDSGPGIITQSVPAPPGANRGVAMLTFDIRLHRGEDAQTVLQWLQTHSVSVAGASGRKIRVYLLENSTLLDEIRAVPEVASLQEYVTPKLHNDAARILLGIDAPNPGVRLPQEGAGQIVAVADTGLDDSHPDFQGRVRGIVALGRPNDYSDPNGHGTHVAGSVLGNGSSSGGTIRGAAPQAELFFQSLLDANGELGGLPLELGTLFEEAYLNGARIHNNSWGAATSSRYTFNSIEVDEFVAKRRDMLVVISAGNEGTCANSRNAGKGFVDWLSLGSPASCKNALTVGASRSDRRSGGYSALHYKDAWPYNFPDAPIGEETVSGNPEGLAAFSSRGPCDDRRLKPDVVAPGTDIASTKSSRAPLSNFWGPYPNNARYAFMGGTSMSAPLVSGCAALAREYYVTARNHHPSAALLKATLINSTVWLTGADSIAPDPGFPNYHQGFGRINMQHAIPNPSLPNLRLEFVDNFADPQTHFVRTGQRVRYQFTIPVGTPWLRICMAYTDLPARALQNNLNLFVEHRASGNKWMGNQRMPRSLNIPDPDNNVEVVRLENPQAGDYMIQISASNLLDTAGQDFALVVTADGLTPLIPV